jgi:hypothetical protein
VVIMTIDETCAPTVIEREERVARADLIDTAQMHARSGSAGLVNASPLQRISQDASVAARHVSLIPGIGYELYGKALLGLPNDLVSTL